MAHVPKLLLLAALIFVWVVPVSGETQRLDGNVAPVSQAIELRIDASQPAYSGSVRIDLMVKEEAESFTFHAEGQEFERLSLSSNEGEIGTSWERGDDAIVTVRPERSLPAGSYTLEIDFTNDFNTSAVGLYRVEHGGDGYLFTQFEAVEARKAFPCWDEPIYKIPFQMTLSAPEEHAVVSNTPVESETEADGWRRTVFAQTKPMPTYLLAIASGPLESREIEGLSVPGRIYSVRGQIGLADQAAAVTPPILAALEDYFGIAVPLQEARLHRHPRILVRSHGERRRGHLHRSAPAAGPRDR